MIEHMLQSDCEANVNNYAADLDTISILTMQEATFYIIPNYCYQRNKS